MDTGAVSTVFEGLGGMFPAGAADFAERLQGIRAFLFDWDGVFHPGWKGEVSAQGFHEADSMGLNLLRFGLWMKQGGVLPVTGILSGEHNAPALTLARRERLHVVYAGVKHKVQALEHFCKLRGLEPREVAFMFDDVLDLSVAAVCGLRIQVQRSASPLLSSYVLAQGLCDYRTAHTAADNAVREVCELSLGMLGLYETTVQERVAWSSTYQSYLAMRQETALHTYTAAGSGIVPVETPVQG